MITGKTVYVLGAGASQHSGAPLLRDFLLGVRILRESNSTLRFKDSFDRVFEWIDGLRASSYYVEFDLDNLEHVFSLAEMSRQLGLNKGDEISTDLRRVIMETLDNTCRVRWYKPDFEPDHSYFRFALCLAELNAQRVKSANQLEGSLEKDAVITFNYDVMLDYAMQWHKMNPEYCLNSDASPTSFRLLKLHGSANWAICKTCSGKPPSVVKAYPMRPGENPPPDLVHGEYYPLRMVTHILSGLTCPHCHDPSKIESLIIPPTWSKTVSDSPIAQVWAQAVREISSAFQIIIIGYSLPATDTFFQYLLTMALTSNSRLHRVIVVNRDDSDEFKQRYYRVFSRSLADRGRLRFVAATTFMQYVNEENQMKKFGSQID